MRITQPMQVEVHGWIMLKGVDSGRYRVEPGKPYNGKPTYRFYRPKGKRCIARHYASSVDGWIGGIDNNRIELL